MKNRHVYIPVMFLLMIFISSCKQSRDLIINEPVKTYMHIAHTRSNFDDRVGSSSANINYNKFDMLWLGGDLTVFTSKDDETMAHVDSIFDVGNKNTLWTLGNHDYPYIDRIQAFTGRPPYYTFHQNGITFIVLDTQADFSNIIGSQKTFFDNVVDTLKGSSHLVILHHKLIWMYGNPELESQITSVSNGNIGNCSFCLNPNDFYTNLYPCLLEVEERGIEVICIGGDIGFKVNEFEFLSPEGIDFLASGISDDPETNKVLLFYHNLTNKLLSWEFKLITDL